ncbi:hypothetical protein AURDEDRAFT_100180 [Auricularia subglabra TFB-10046 SS5]|nr:hypothetical protein AURDEDRAFT_100180 [Auricularia subglabra TFB-10046 SS5]
MMEAVTEFDTPHLSVFDARKLPAKLGDALPPVAIAAMDAALRNRTEAQIKHPGYKPLWYTGSVADSASLGVTDIIAAVTTGEERYSTSAAEQLDFLLNDAPHKGVLISHRNETFQAWADFISMAPPFIAYSGAAQGGREGKALLVNAYQQCQGYREILRDPATDLWRHVLEGSWSDTGLWITGNAWAAFGMLRVQQTIAKSDVSRQLRAEQADLLAWTDEILTAAWARQGEAGGIPNYMDKADQFEDSAGTALLAATSYRLAIITRSDKHIANAEKALTRMMELTDADGWVHGAVDPYNFARPAEGNTPNGYSPEAQCFVVMLDVAARNYYSSGIGIPV